MTYHAAMLETGVALDWEFTPLEALRRWPSDRGVVMLHSGRPDPRWARWSLLAEPCAWWHYIEDPALPHGGRGVWLPATQQPRRPVPCPVTFTHRPFADLRALLDANDGVWIGYLGYDLGRWIEKLPTTALRDRDWPTAALAWCGGYLLHDALTARWRACGTWAERDRKTVPKLDAQTHDRPAFTASSLRSNMDRRDYLQRVLRIKDYIAAGDVFQVNFAQRLTADFHADAPRPGRSLYQQLATHSPAWYGAYLELDGHRALASTSPELFLEMDAQRKITTRPIKGTRPASDPVSELLHSEKDTAELNMIVDLLRNDLGRVCDYGSVRVEQPRTIETHPTVHHGVATVTGRLHSQMDVVDLLKATMPGGSITGAPKVRAMQVIDGLEPVRRGPYCGAVGVLTKNTATLNVAIRTMLLDTHAQRVDFSVGGGIVADSQPQAEYDETRHKAAAMLNALGLRWTLD
ncbi:MAG: aminodeoxychorismate synthase, component I [Phycisphaera sp.]|nr:aminodeoxychorismate synthase, component I [Phycisphaera sp.]